MHRNGMNQPSLHLALLGRTGSGKSASGNTILGRDVFRENSRPYPIHMSCEMETTDMDGRNISVIDTPGLFNNSVTDDQLQAEMRNCACMSFPGLDVFLLVISLDVRLTDEERNIVTCIQNIFGADAARYTFILFTHADRLNGETLDDYIRSCLDLQSLINSCGGRYYAFNNRRRDRDQVRELLQLIERMAHNNGKHHRTLYEFQRTETYNTMVNKALYVAQIIGVATVVVGAACVVPVLGVPLLGKKTAIAVLALVGVGMAALNRAREDRHRY